MTKTKRRQERYCDNIMEMMMMMMNINWWLRISTARAKCFSLFLHQPPSLSIQFTIYSIWILYRYRSERVRHHFALFISLALCLQIKWNDIVPSIRKIFADWEYSWNDDRHLIVYEYKRCRCRLRCQPPTGVNETKSKERKIFCVFSRDTRAQKWRNFRYCWSESHSRMLRSCIQTFLSYY